METLRKLLVVFIGFPIGITLALTIGISVTLIWPIYILCSLIDNAIRYFAKIEKSENNWLNSMVEFIFAGYGFAGLFILLSLMAFEPNDVK